MSAPDGVTVIGGSTGSADTRERAQGDGHYLLNGQRHIVRAGDPVPYGAELTGSAKGAPDENKAKPAPSKAKPKPGAAPAESK